MLEGAERAQAQGQPEEAGRLLAAAQSLAPENAAVLAAHGLYALRKGDAAEARQWLEKSLSQDASDPRVHLNLATSLRALNDADTEMKALDQALTLDPYFFPAVMQKASLLEQMGKGREAARTYGRALATLREGDRLPAGWQALVEHAQRTTAADRRELEEWLNTRMQDVRERHS